MEEEKKITIEITQKDFDTLCLCAVRYCHGRQTYMPSLVQDICRSHFNDLSDDCLRVMADDCSYQQTFQLYGDEKIDKPGWIHWEDDVKKEYLKRKEKSGK